MPTIDSSTNNLVVVVLIGIIFVCIVGFIFYKLRNKIRNKFHNRKIIQDEKVVKEVLEVKVDDNNTKDSKDLTNCRVFSTSKGLRIYRCDKETGQPISKLTGDKYVLQSQQ